MDTRIDEIEGRIYRISTFVPEIADPAGFTFPAETRRRALLAYSAYLGHGQVAHSTPGVLPATRAGRRAYLNDAIRALTTR